MLGCAATSSLRTATRTITPELVQESVRVNQERVHSMRGEGNLAVETPEIAQSASFVIMLKKPDSLLVEIRGPFGIEIGTALLTRREFLFYNSMQNRLISGPMNPTNLGRVFRMSLTFDELLDLVAGGTFFPEDRTAPDSFTSEEERLVLTYNRGQGKRRYLIDPASLLIETIQHFDSQGKLVFEQRFKNFRAVEGTTLPFHVRMTQHRERRRVTLSYSEVSINTNAVEFNFNIPTNADRVRWQQ